jgi:hypothetical protein
MPCFDSTCRRKSQRHCSASLYNGHMLNSPWFLYWKLPHWWVRGEPGRRCPLLLLLSF